MDIQKLMKQAKEMQNSLARIEDELNATEYIGNSGGAEGVFVTINGKNEVVEVRIADELMTAENREMLQDLILLATNEAVEKARVEREEKIGSAAGGFGLPGM